MHAHVHLEFIAFGVEEDATPFALVVLHHADEDAAIRVLMPGEAVHLSLVPVTIIDIAP